MKVVREVRARPWWEAPDAWERVGKQYREASEALEKAKRAARKAEEELTAAEFRLRDVRRDVDMVLAAIEKRAQAS